MSTWQWVIHIALAMIGLGGSALFSGIETGFYAISRIRLRLLADQADHSRQARATLDEISHTDRLLATVLIGNNVANYIGVLGVTVLLAGLGVGPVGLVVIQVCALTPIILLFGEALPKELFRTDADRYLPRLIWFIRLVRLILTATGTLGLILWCSKRAARLVGLESRDNVRQYRSTLASLLAETASEGLISPEQSARLGQVTAFQSASVASHMTPWFRVQTIHADETASAARQRLGLSPHARLPVVSGDEKEAVGKNGGLGVGMVSYVELCRAGDGIVCDFAGSSTQISASASVAEAIVAIQQGEYPVGVVMESGRPIGMVSLSDLVEPLIGKVAG